MSPPPHHVPFSTSPVAGQKRPAPSLLPPFTFEPSSSSPALPRLEKRLTHASPSKKLGLEEKQDLYPTPVPTSSTLIPTSSPPQLPNTRRPKIGLQRTASTISERAPLAAVPSIELSEHGEPTLMGRSSNSSHYQLSTNKLISRVHVRAIYIAAKVSGDAARVQIECTGWNGCKVHCQGRAWDLMKGDTFTSETEDADIMVDVQDARVLLTWPRLSEGKVLTPTDTDGSSWEGENNSPQRRVIARVSRGGGTGTVHTSPLRQQHRLQSPVSPSPAVQATHAVASGFLDSNPPQSVPVKIYEDEPSDGEKEKDLMQSQQTQILTQTSSQTDGMLEEPQAFQELTKASQDTTTSSLSDPPHDFSDNDEENDPIISSFGPFGADLHARMEHVNTLSPSQGLASSPESHRRRPLQPLKDESISPQRQKTGASPSNKRRRLAHNRDISSIFTTYSSEADKELTNHVINQLAYSALSATPLSTLYDSIPNHLKVFPEGSAMRVDTQLLHISMLKSLIDAAACVGTVARTGKDAAGIPLESEYYYIPEQDADEKRREVVMGLGGRGLRECRKSHKQYFWRKPK